MALIWDSNKNGYVGTFIVGPGGVSQIEDVDLGNFVGNVTIRLEGLDPQLEEQVDSINIIDCTPSPPQYILSSSVSVTNEGQDVSVTLTDAPVGRYYFNITGQDITEGDIMSSSSQYSSLSGYFNITVDGGSDTLDFEIVNDRLTENTEVLILTLRDIENRVIAIPIHDTSKSPTFILTSNLTEVVEGNPVTITLTADPGTYNYVITGENIDSADFNENLVGNFNIPVGETSVSKVLNLKHNDDGHDGDETFTLSLENGKSSIDIKILEPSFTLKSEPCILEEGMGIDLTLTTDAPDGEYFYTIEGDIDSHDIIEPLKGSFNVVNGQGVKTINVAKDLSEEIPELVTIKLDNGKAEISSFIKNVKPVFTLSTSNPTNEFIEGYPIPVTLYSDFPGTYTYSILGDSSITSDDFSSGFTGTFTIGASLEDTQTIVLSQNDDSSSSLLEKFNLVLDNGLSELEIKILEPTFTLKAEPCVVDEGKQIKFELTTNAPAGTYGYTIEGDIDPSDITQPLTGNFTVDATGKASVDIDIILDSTQEVPEILTLKLDNGKAEVSATIRD